MCQNVSSIQSAWGTVDFSKRKAHQASSTLILARFQARLAYLEEYPLLFMRTVARTQRKGTASCSRKKVENG
jgi:hypothetical protein